jgi:hypothetical protein
MRRALGGASMKEEVGRWFTWFLEPRSDASYQRHHSEEIESAKHLSWRCLIGVVVDKRLFPKANEYPQLFRGFTSSFPAHPPQPWWQHYAEVTGKGQWLIRLNGEDYLTLVCDDEPMTLTIPLKAIVSSRSTGFPKVAYNVERYLLAYLEMLMLFTDATMTQEARLLQVTELQSTLLEVNYPLPILAIIQSLVRQWIDRNTIDPTRVQLLQTMMINDMLTQLEIQCKGMYHHAMEWNLDASILKKNHPLIYAYLGMRKRFPNMVPGRAFIPVYKN